MSGRRKTKKQFHLSIVIDTEEVDCAGYDLDNSKPWPLGSYGTEKQAIAARNSIVVIKPKP